MTVSWRFECDGDGCKATEVVPRLAALPVGWMHRVIVDRVDGLGESSTGTGFPGGRSQVEAERHYCDRCRRKVMR